MASQYLRRFPVPEDFREILQDFTREILREQPSDIIAFAVHYFHCKEEVTCTQNEPFTWEDPNPRNPKPADYPVDGGQPKRDEIVVRPRTSEKLGSRTQISRGTEDSRTPYSENSRKQTSGEPQGKPSEGSERDAHGYMDELFDKTVKNLSS